MAGTGGPEAGEIVRCPRCEREVRQKSMIPVLAEDATQVLVCVDCARSLIATAEA